MDPPEIHEHKIKNVDISVSSDGTSIEWSTTAAITNNGLSFKDQVQSSIIAPKTIPDFKDQVRTSHREPVDGVVHQPVSSNNRKTDPRQNNVGAQHLPGPNSPIISDISTESLPQQARDQSAANEQPALVHAFVVDHTDEIIGAEEVIEERKCRPLYLLITGIVMVLVLVVAVLVALLTREEENAVPGFNPSPAPFQVSSSPTLVPRFQDSSSPTTMPSVRASSSPTTMPSVRASSSPASVQPIQVSITFNGKFDFDGWSLSGDGESLNWNGSGYISGTDGGRGLAWYFEAPSKFSGNLLGCRLSYELKQDGIAPSIGPRVFVVLGTAMSISSTSIGFVSDDVSDHPGLNFTQYDYFLHPNTRWFLLSDDGSPNVTATTDIVESVLSNVRRLAILGEYSSALDTGSLDNVFLEC